MVVIKKNSPLLFPYACLSTPPNSYLSSHVTLAPPPPTSPNLPWRSFHNVTYKPLNKNHPLPSSCQPCYPICSLIGLRVRITFSVCEMLLASNSDLLDGATVTYKYISIPPYPTIPLPLPAIPTNETVYKHRTFFCTTPSPPPPVHCFC